MFENLANARRIELAKTKMEKVLDHFLYVLELHANNAFVVYSPILSSQIPTSYAANAFNVFQKSMYQIEIVRLCALWDRAEAEKENIPTVIELINDDVIIDMLSEKTRQSFASGNTLLFNPSDDSQLNAIEQQALRDSEMRFANEQASRANAELVEQRTGDRSAPGRHARKVQVPSKLQRSLCPPKATVCCAAAK